MPSPQTLHSTIRMAPSIAARIFGEQTKDGGENSPIQIGNF